MTLISCCDHEQRDVSTNLTAFEGAPLTGNNNPFGGEIVGKERNLRDLRENHEWRTKILGFHELRTVLGFPARLASGSVRFGSVRDSNQSETDHGTARAKIYYFEPKDEGKY